ncbi:MAG TPA: SDR family oxidoreductase [Edaphobacter sp.]|nr:SDR family oxidoreductase [Edaphobacter sp.]
MRVFLTGATGFIGSAIVPELIGAGHTVLGLTRSDAGAESLLRAGAEVHRGDLDDIDSLRAGAAACDAVIHTAFNHDFSRFQESCEQDRPVIEAMGAALEGSARPLIVTSGIFTPMIEPGRVVTEEMPPASSKVMARAASEEAAAAVAARGGNAMVVRLPQVHDTNKQGLITYAIHTAREKGASAYIGDGHHRWAAVSLPAAARLYRLALEKGRPGARYHAIAEEGVPMREIAETVGRGLRVPVVSLSPEEAAAHFGWMAFFAGIDAPASSVITQRELDWTPEGPTLLEDLENMRYSD